MERELSESDRSSSDVLTSVGLRKPVKKVKHKDNVWVGSSSIYASSLHVSVPLLMRLYAFPFVVPYSLLVWLYTEHFDLVGSQEGFFLISFVLVILHGLSVLSCEWSVTLKAFMTLKKVSDPWKATLIKINPVEHRGLSEICQLQRTVEENGKVVLWFTYQKRIFTYDENDKKFLKVDYPVSETISTYLTFRGYDSNSLKAAFKKWGKNEFQIPLPTFKELYKEQAVAPFFVFQVFCVALWCLDEYWYYSIFTLFMLLVFEATVVMQRLRNMKELRNMAPKPYDVLVYRNKTWEKRKTDELIPGDLFSIVRSSEDSSVPCDAVILSGSCIVNEAMLTGESVPQQKESIFTRAPSDVLDMSKDKINIVFSGTKVVQIGSNDNELDIKSPEDNGCIAYVIRTGFGTSQGKLVRTILFSTERVTANNYESLFFILFLLIFAIAASSYVWIKGTENTTRSRSKLLLDCVLIITSVVPPELPMELALAVNQSLIALFKFAIFCTEPFRIPFAGKVDICCFDKTGTLTSDQLELKGVAGLDGEEALKQPDSLPEETQFILATCHSLMNTDTGLIGDPMEKVALESIKWTYSSGIAKNGNKKLKVVKKYPFSSSLKRMSTISLVQDNQHFVSVKGAPEVLENMFANNIPNYTEIHKKYSRMGSRVLALGYKTMDIRPNEMKDLPRNNVESQLIFGGFLVFFCPLKPDSAHALKELRDSSHRNVMITGDSALTACYIGKEVGIVVKPAIIMDVKGHIEFPQSENDIELKTVDEDVVLSLPKTIKELEDIAAKFDLCATGVCLRILESTKLGMYPYLPKIRVYARTSPDQKEYILTSMKKANYITLMCGDGTNDVGALKQAHIGVALLDGKPEDLKKFVDQRNLAEQIKKRRQIEESKRKLQELQQNRTIGSASKAEQQKQIAESLKLMVDQMENDVPMVKLGDASIAAPFTSKINYVTSVSQIIKQGRSALVTTIQMYKILALNCLITAYSLSVLYLDGIKYGDIQMTVTGIMMSICFLSLSRANSVERLSKERPQSNIFNFYIIPSILGQFAVHVYSLIHITALAKSFMEIQEGEKIDLDKEFSPNLLNGGIYLIGLSMQVSNFVINYQGKPFRESMTENKPMFYSLSFVSILCLFAASGASEEIRETLQLVPFPTAFRDELLMTIILDFAAAYFVEKVTAFLFADSKPKKSLGLR